MIQRVIELDSVLKNVSVFLFGPRQTGKTTYLKQTYPQALFFNLLEQRTFRTLSARPEVLREMITSKHRIVIVDEVQKLPSLLNEVQDLIETRKNIRFILTGSSARKLMRGKANLLGGR